MIRELGITPIPIEKYLGEKKGKTLKKVAAGTAVGVVRKKIKDTTAATLALRDEAIRSGEKQEEPRQEALPVSSDDNVLPAIERASRRAELESSSSSDDDAPLGRKKIRKLVSLRNKKKAVATAATKALVAVEVESNEHPEQEGPQLTAVRALINLTFPTASVDPTFPATGDEIG